MLVVCDTTPINYLLLIDLIDLIPRLYATACIPPAVAEELGHPKAPLVVRTWIEMPPDWMSIEQPGPVVVPFLLHLDRGEREAIAVVERLGADFLLTDDREARKAANERGIETVTTLLILDAAADRGWINFQAALALLLKTNFRVDPFTLEELVEKHAWSIIKAYGLRSRQLRQLYLQPGAIHGGVGGGGGGAAE